MLDVIVVGAGPDGLSAALTLGRRHRRVLVLDSGEAHGALAAGVHMVLSRDGLTSAGLRPPGREDLAAYGTIEFREGAATSAATAGDGFEVALSDEGTARARVLILAAGGAGGVPGLEAAAGRSGTPVSRCPFCCGLGTGDQSLAGLGNDDFAHAVLVACLTGQLAGDVVLCAGGRQQTATSGVFAADGMARHATSYGPAPFTVAFAADGVRAAIRADQALLTGDLGLTLPGRG